jgi:hypothetical protein
MQTSRALSGLLDRLPPDRVSVGWLSEQLKDRSFGFVMLVLALIGLAPGVASVSGFLLAVPALQMMMGRQTLMLPEFLAKRSTSSEAFAKWLKRMIPVFARVENILPESKREHAMGWTRLIGFVDFLLALAIIAPVPFAYIPPTLAIVFISFAQIEDSGFLLALAFIIALAAIAFVTAVSWTVLLVVLRLIGL